MHSPSYLKLLLADQLRLNREIKARSSALYEDGKSLDQALTERKYIDHIEAELELVDDEIILHADLGFFGYTQPGGLTTLFYGYTYHTPPLSPPGH